MSTTLDVASAPALSATTTALIVVDMQYFDAHREWGEGRTAQQLGVASHFDDYFRQIDDIVPRVRRLLDAFRGKHMEVIHVRVAEQTRDSRDVGLKQLVRGLIVPIDSKEAEFLPGLEPVDDEIVIGKSSSGVFPATNLDRLLRNMAIDTLVFAGTSTSGCVQSAVYDALDLGYEVMVVDDASADSTQQAQHDALAGLAQSATRLVSTEQVEQVVRSLPAVDPVARSGTARVGLYRLPSAHLPKDPPLADVNPYSLIFGPAVALDIHPASTVLVLIDAQRLTCDPAFRFGPLVRHADAFAGFYDRVPAALGAMSGLLSACRDHGYPIIHVRTAGHLGDGRDLSPNLRRQGVRTAVQSAEAAFMPEVAPIPGEVVLNKPACGIFTGTGLDELLRNMEIRHLVLAGVSVDGAVEASIRSAGDRGYGVLLVPDACVAAAGGERRLRMLESGTVTVRPTRDAIERLATLPRQRP